MATVATLDDFLVALSHRMGWEPTPWRLNVLRQMAQNEGNIDKLQQMWNPLSTTMPGGENPNFDIGYGPGNWNWNGGSPVKVYKDMATGVEQTARTLEGDYYPNLRKAMETQTAVPGVEQDLASWGWAPGTQSSDAILSAMGGTITQGGGATMANGEQENKTLQQLIDTIVTGLTSKDPLAQNNAQWFLGQLPADVQRIVLGVGEGTEPLSEYQAGQLGLGAQSQALAEKQFQFSMDEALRQAALDEKQFGLAIAAQNFANTINQAQEARARAQFALDYTRAQAPPGVTEVPGTEATSVSSQYLREKGYTPQAPMPMVKGNLPADPWALLGQAGATIPAGPQVPSTPPSPAMPAPTTGYTAPPTAAPVSAPPPTPSPVTPSGDMTNQGPLMTALPTAQSLMAGLPTEMLPFGTATGQDQILLEAMRRLGLGVGF